MPCSSIWGSGRVKSTSCAGQRHQTDKTHLRSSPLPRRLSPPAAVASGLPAQALTDNVPDTQGSRARRASTYLCRSSRYLKRLKLRQSTGGSSFIFIRFCASCRQPQVSQLNLSSASRVSVELQHRDQLCQCRSRIAAERQLACWRNSCCGSEMCPGSPWQDGCAYVPAEELQHSNMGTLPAGC